jgi:predicted DsbA family dithiol-disulfide isomerase
VEIEIWSDIVCPFCYVGKRHLERALEAFDHGDAVTVTWRSFELDPAAEAVASESLVEKIARKYGMSLEQSEASQKQLAERAAATGLEFNWQAARYGNTFDAHRVVHLAAQHGLADAAHERLMRAYFTEGLAVGDRAVLRDLAGQVGLGAEQVERLLTSDEYAASVRADESLARDFGISSVPFYVFDRKYAVSGAQPVEVFSRALTQAWTGSHTVQA